MQFYKITLLLFLSIQIAIGNEPCPETQSLFQMASLQLKKLEDYLFPTLKYNPSDIEKFIDGDFKFSKSFLYQKLKSATKQKTFKDISFIRPLKNFKLNESRPLITTYKLKVLERINEIENRLKTFKALPHPAQIIIERSEDALKRLRQVANEIDTVLDSSEVTYFDYLELSAKTTAVLDRSIPADKYSIVVKDLTLKTFQNYELVARDGGILWPTSQNLKIDDFIDTVDSKVNFVGVSYTNSMADGRNYTPVNFFEHDLLHSKIINSKQRMISGLSQDFINTFRIKIKDLPPEQSEMFKIFFFHYVHEIVPRERDMYAFQVKRLYQSYLKGISSVEKTVKQNYSKPISRTQIKNEIRAFILFLETF